jgi:hypothetical protein
MIPSDSSDHRRDGALSVRSGGARVPLKVRGFGGTARRKIELPEPANTPVGNGGGAQGLAIPS